jgi:PmbA protein
MNPEELLGVAERLVEKGARKVDQIEVYLETGASLDVDVEANQLAGSGTSKSQGGGVRIVQGGRLGFAYFTDYAKGELAVEQALHASKLSPQKMYNLPEGRPVSGISSWDDAIASLDPTMAVDLANNAMQGALEIAPDAIVGGGAGIGWGMDAIASSQGVSAWDASTQVSAGVSVVLDRGQTVNAWDGKSAHAAPLDATKIGSEVAETCVDLLNPVASETGEMDILFLPNAVGELVGGIIESAVDGDEAMRGKSVWSGKLGESVAHSGFSIIDNPTAPGALGVAATDAEGLVARDNAIIKNGVLKSFLFDSWDAHEHGQKSTHSASRSGFKSQPGTGSQHWDVTHNNAISMDKMKSDMDGYMVESVLGAHTANTTTGDFSVTATNVWRVKNGEKAASTEVAISGNLPDLLGRLDACCNNPVRKMGSVLPALRFRDVSVSS